MRHEGCVSRSQGEGVLHCRAIFPRSRTPLEQPPQQAKRRHGQNDKDDF